VIKITFRPEAEAELLAAKAWYEQRSPGLGFEFARAVDSAIAKALRNPLAYSRIADEFRHIVLRRFPYSVIYLPNVDELLVVACFHHRREQDSWQGRVS
jgi:plasmid stabilization system protein ParE